MSFTDEGRKPIHKNVEEKLKPDDQKTYAEQFTNSVTSTGDKVLGSIQPEDSKSTTQKAADHTRSGIDKTEDSSKSYLDSAKDTASSITQSASDALSNAANTLTGNTETK